METVHFVHGKESGPWGSKITFLAGIARSAGLNVESLDYSDLDSPMARARRLNAACNQALPAILVGSSMGGWVANAASIHPVKAVLLLAPAFYMPGYEDYPPNAPITEIVHGWRDDVIPCENSIRFAREYDCTLHLIDDDHRLSKRLDLLGDYFSSLIKRVL